MMLVSSVETDVQVRPYELSQPVEVSRVAVKARRFAMNVEHEVAAAELVERFTEDMDPFARDDATDEAYMAYFVSPARLTAELVNCEAVGRKEQTISIGAPFDESVAMKPSWSGKCLARVYHSANVCFPCR